MIQNFVSKLSPQEKKILYITVAFVLVAFIDRLFLGPAFSKIASLDEEIEKQKGVITRDLRFLSYKDKILNEDTNFSIYYSQAGQTEEEVIAKFLKTIEMLASQAQVNLIKVNPSDTKEKKGYKEYYANLECDGTLKNIITFMHLVDTSNDLLRIVKINVNPKRASAEEISTAMTVQKILITTGSASENSLDGGETQGGGDVAGGKGSASASGGGQGKGNSAGAGKALPANGEANTDEKNNNAESSGKKANAQTVSERLKPKVNNDQKKTSNEKAEENDEIKPSIFEKMTKQTESTEEPTE